VTVEAAAVQYTSRHVENVDWNAIRVADGQFVFVTVDASEAEPVPGRAAFALVTDDGVYDPVAIDRRYPIDLDVPGGPYAPEQGGTDPRGWLVFDVPARLGTLPSLRLDHDTGSWEWELDAEKAVRPPPAWEWTASARRLRPTRRSTSRCPQKTSATAPGRSAAR
jgi:hypothetical protein